MRSVLLLLFLLVVVGMSVIEAVEKAKFKTCAQSGFCRRNRALADAKNEDLRAPYKIVENSLKKETPHKTIGLIENVEENVKFEMEVSTYQSNVVRLRVKEKEPLRERYEVKEVLHNKYLEEHEERHELVKTGSKATISTDTVTVEVDEEKLEFQVYIDGDAAVTLNKRGLFSFEHTRAKEQAVEAVEKSEEEAEEGEAADEDNEAAPVENAKYRIIDSADGGWDESFGSHKDSKPFGPQSLGMDVSFPAATDVYGIPEHATSLSLKPTRGSGAAGYQEPYRLYNLDVFEYELDNPMALYGSVPILLAHRADGKTVAMFWFNAAETWVDVEKDKDGTDTHWYSEVGNMDVFLLLGPTAPEVFHQIAELTGFSDQPPLFSIAYHQCRWNYKSEEDVAQVDANFDLYDIPYDVLWLDIEHTRSKRYFTWDDSHFPTPQRMIDDVSSRGRRMVTIVDPHIKRDSDYYVHKQAQDNHYYVLNKDNADYEGWCWPGSSSWVDYTSPAARYWWQELFSYDQYQGSTPALFIWNDMNEPSVFNGPEVTMHKDAIHHGSYEHREVHNIYGLLTHRATALGLVKRNKGHNERPFVLSRAFYAGTQKWGAIWTGDNGAEWGHLEASSPMLQTIGLVGLPFAGADVGGFFGDPEPELLLRWYQAGAYQPFFRAHAHLDAKRREPWLFGDEWTNGIRKAVRARYALLPYWYTAFYHSRVTGEPVMRPLWVEWPTDRRTFAMEDQWLVDSNLLVKPIVARGQTSTTVYLPGGQAQRWYDVDNWRLLRGPFVEDFAAPLDKIPVFQRGGSIIARKERPRRSTAQMVGDPYTLTVALDDNASASGDLYVDDFHSFDYKHGHYALIHFNFDGKHLSFSSHLTHHTDTLTDAVIERIRFLGFPATRLPQQILASGSSTPLDFEYDAVGSVLTIRKPDFSIFEAFTFSFKK